MHGLKAKWSFETDQALYTFMEPKMIKELTQSIKHEIDIEFFKKCLGPDWEIGIEFSRISEIENNEY